MYIADEKKSLPRVVDQTSEDLLRIATHELWSKVGKTTMTDLSFDLNQRFQGLRLGINGTCDAIATTPYLRSMLGYLETVVTELASGFSSTRWLWYLRRLPTFIFEGSISTTHAYDASLAETASGTSLKGADNLRIKGIFLQYPSDGASVKRIFRYCYTIRLMSSIHRSLRYAGKGCSFRFTGSDAFPSPTPRTEEEHAIVLYDTRMAASQFAFSRGGTDLIDQDHKASEGILSLQRMTPKWLPSFVRTDNSEHKEVEVFSRFMPEIISFNRLRELNSDPRVLGGAWIGREAGAIILLLSATLRFAGALRAGFASLMQYGYFVISDETLRTYLTDGVPAIAEGLCALIPAQSIPASGNEVMTIIDNIKGSLWPLAPGPIIRRNGEMLWLDLYAATVALDVRLEFPRTAGDSIANARAEHFEDSVQQVINTSGWQPSPKLRQLQRRRLRIGGSDLSDLDAIGSLGTTLLLISCKSIIYSAAYDVGDHKAVRNAASTVIDGVAHWHDIVDTLKTKPVGDNYDFSSYEQFVPLVCTPRPVYVPLGIATEYVLSDLRAAVSVEELSSWLEKNRSPRPIKAGPATRLYHVT